MWYVKSLFSSFNHLNQNFEKTSFHWRNILSIVLTWNYSLTSKLFYVYPGIHCSIIDFLEYTRLASVAHWAKGQHFFEICNIKSLPLFSLLTYRDFQWQAHEVVFLTKFHDDSSKIVDFLLLVKFLSCVIFLDQSLPLWKIYNSLWTYHLLIRLTAFWK